MKKIFTSILLFSLVGHTFAGIITSETFDLYDDGGEKQPHYLMIQKTDSKLSKIQLFADYNGKSVLLFDIDSKELDIRESNETLIAETISFIQPTLKGSYYHPWGDASIETGHLYNIGFNITEGCLEFAEDEYEFCRIEVSDHDAGEMAMWGTLVKRK